MTDGDDYWNDPRFHPEHIDDNRNANPGKLATHPSPVSAPSPAGGVREAGDLRRAIHEIVEWVEMEVDLSLRPALRKRIEAAKTLLERPALSSPATPEPVSAPATDGEVVVAVLWARFVPDWGRMQLCDRGDFGALEYRLSNPAPGHGEAVPVAARSEPAAEMGWQDISTAPRKHGDRLLLALSNGLVVEGRWGTGRYDRSRKEYNTTWVVGAQREVAPTHWRHMPAHPHALTPEAPGAQEETSRPSCPNTGLPCVPACDQKKCAGLHIPLNEWPV